MIPDTILPTLDAALNALSAVLLCFGVRAIRAGDRERHKKIMMAALVSSSCFLAVYLVFHYRYGSVAYPFQDWTRPVYFAVLVPHVILAAAMVPFIILMVARAVKGDFERHKRLARYVWPVWLYVSVTGVIVYLMLYGRSYLLA